MRPIFSNVLIVFISIIFSGSVGAAMAAETFKDCSVCPTMVKVPRGSFLMGTAPANSDTKAPRSNPTRSDPADREDSDNELSEYSGGGDEQPQHRVEFKKPFAIGRYPVARGEFATFVRETGYDPKRCFMPPPDEDEPAVLLPRGLSWRNPGFAQSDRDPVVCVALDDAKRYAAWLGKRPGRSYRLPTEAEWEYAARADTTTPRYWVGGDADVCRYANVLDRSAAEAFEMDKDKKDSFYPCRDGYVFTAPCGSFPPNAFGLYDMLGNVWQWVGDCYTPNYKDADANGAAPENESGGCDRNVLRGGSWGTSIDNVRSAYRHGDVPDKRTIFHGFRVVRPF